MKAPLRIPPVDELTSYHRPHGLATPPHPHITSRTTSSTHGLWGEGRFYSKSRGPHRRTEQSFPIAKHTLSQAENTRMACLYFLLPSVVFVFQTGFH